MLAGAYKPKAPDGNNRSFQEVGNIEMRDFQRFDLETNGCYPKPEKHQNRNSDGHYEKV